MKELICKSCGGTMVIDASSMSAVCNFCGVRYVLDHEDTDYYKNYYDKMMSFLLLSKNDRERQQKAEAIWEKANSKVFVTDEGAEIEVRYLHKYSDKNADVYVARKNIIFHFVNNGLQLSNAFRSNVSLLDYPTADIRALSDHFPKVSGAFVLNDGSCILVIKKDEDEYPLRLFGTLHGRHVAWIISRMENLCCVLEYNSMVHPEISADTLFINPYTHQVSLYGNWWSVTRNNSYSPQAGNIVTTQTNLICIRKVAANLLGATDINTLYYNPDIPKPMVDFIRSIPADNAYDDFSVWDQCLIESYGERKFIDFDTDDGQVYNKR